MHTHSAIRAYFNSRNNTWEHWVKSWLETECRLLFYKPLRDLSFRIIPHYCLNSPFFLDGWINSLGILRQTVKQSFTLTFSALRYSPHLLDSFLLLSVKSPSLPSCHAQNWSFELQLLQLTGVPWVASRSCFLCHLAQLLFCLLLRVQSHRETRLLICL